MTERTPSAQAPETTPPETGALPVDSDIKTPHRAHRPIHLHPWYVSPVGSAAPCPATDSARSCRHLAGGRCRHC